MWFVSSYERWQSGSPAEHTLALTGEPETIHQSPDDLSAALDNRHRVSDTLTESDAFLSGAALKRS